ncbi:MAG: hypothetical protein V3U37_01480 [Nitrospinaceae bacterium]
MSSIAHVASPETEELKQKRKELSALERELTDRELQLSTLKGEIHFFERLYERVVGVKYAELDEVKAQVLELASRLYPRSDEFRTGAESAREKAGKSANESSPEEVDVPQEKDFKPPESLKKLFRRVAKKIHPDLASDEKERALRDKLMARLNRAYDRMDQEAIRAVLTDWESGDHADGETNLGTRLVRTVRQIAQVRKRLNSIFTEMEKLENSGMNLLKNRIESAKKESRDFLQEKADEIDEKIISLKSKIKDLADELA